MLGLGGAHLFRLDNEDIDFHIRHVIMAGDEIFVYMGGDQEVPIGVRRARIHNSVKTIPTRAFCYRRQLTEVEFHDDIETIEEEAFDHCLSLRSIKLLGVKQIKARAFQHCTDMTDVEFGDKLETIGIKAFQLCALRSVAVPSVRSIGGLAFDCCFELYHVECGEVLETVGERAFHGCSHLERITLPLKEDIITDNSSIDCSNLASVHLVGGIHSTVASLHLESWRNEIDEEISRINQVLPTTALTLKPTEIRQWMESVAHRLGRYKAEHNLILKEATTLLELALWKANLNDNEGGVLESEGVRTTRGRRKRARKEVCITSGASIVIKNVLPFLYLKS